MTSYFYTVNNGPHSALNSIDDFYTMIVRALDGIDDYEVPPEFALFEIGSDGNTCLLDVVRLDF